MEYQTITVEIENNIATITLNRPDKLNAIDTQMIDELTRVTETLGKDENVNVVVLTGAGRGFCSGGDLSMDVYTTTDPGDLYRFMDTVAQMALGIRYMPQPVIAAVNGVAAGGGCNLALGCDMIVASEKARFSEIFVRANLHPDTGGTYFLPRMVGTPKAMEIMLTGRMVEAQEAAEIGLVNRVVPADQLLSATMELAGAIAQASPVVTRMIKNSIYGGVSGDLSTALENETKAAILIMTSGTFKKG
ncbi:MAG: enoyl-CoA hydratase/isomerase family protein [Deltaproteobacteria bacterium]|nr:enoyl-CoA hydratase/isomerase family protein [Deltaproteobacteria bacterium]